jgi:dihydropteroate synthase
MVNDISAGTFDAELWPTVVELKVPYVLMHMKGTPANMQNNPSYDDVVIEVLDFFSSHVHQLRQQGMNDIIIDPGFGFGKTLEHNYRLLANLSAFGMLGLPVLVGVSRKSMISKTLGVSVDQTLNGTTALHVIALLNGARILRAHDVREAVEAVRIVKAYDDQVAADNPFQT